MELDFNIKVILTEPRLMRPWKNEEKIFVTRLTNSTSDRGEMVTFKNSAGSLGVKTTTANE